MSDSHPLLNILPGGVPIRVGDQSMQVLDLVDRRNGLVIYTVQNQATRDTCLLKIANPSEDTSAYEQWKKTLQNEAQVLNSLKAANLADRHHLPLVYALSKAHIIEDQIEHIYTVALLTQLPQGENIAQMLRNDAKASERVALRIGSQVAQVLVLAHQEGYQCGPVTPDRLFWDNVNQHVTITDWYLPQEMQSLETSARIARKQDDTRSLALLIYWIVTGQQPAASGESIDLCSEMLSAPLWNLLERVANHPASLGEEPAALFFQELTRLLRCWDLPDLFTQAEQQLADIRKQRSSVDLATLQMLSEQIEIGRLREPERPWQRLIESSRDLLAQPLEQVRTTIMGGHFRQALQQTRALAPWASIQRSILWRQRIAEIGVADSRLTTDKRLAQYRTSMGQAIKAWDEGDYTIPDWLQQLGSLFSQIILSPQAQAVMQRLAYELQIAGLTGRFESTQDVGEKIDIINTLDKLALPEGIEPLLLERRRQVCGTRKQLEAHYNRLQSEQRQAAFLGLLRQLEQRVVVRDPSLVAADFDQIIRQAPSTDYRQKAVDLQSIWSAIKLIRALPEHGDVAEAVRQFVRLRRLNAPADLISELEPFIAAESLRQFGLERSASSIASAFDSIVQQPKLTLELLMEHRRWLHALLPAVDAQRRLQYDHLLQKEAQIRKSLETLDSAAASLPEQTEALTYLREQGITSLQHLYLRVLAQGHLQQEHARYQTELINLLEQTLTRLRTFAPARAYVPATFAEDVAAVRQAILAGKTAGVREQHRVIWEQTASFAPDYEDLYNQHLYFSAQQSAAEFKSLWGNDARPELSRAERRPADLLRAIETASRVGRLQHLLAETPYGSKVAAFVSEQRSQLDGQVQSLLQSGADGAAPEQQTRALLAARQHLALYDALAGIQPEPGTTANQTAAQTLLGYQDPAILRAALRCLPVEISEARLQELLAHAPPATGALPGSRSPLLMIALVIVFVVGLVLGMLLL